MNLAHIIRPEHTFVGVSVPTKWRALQNLADRAGKAFGIEE